MPTTRPVRRLRAKRLLDGSTVVYRDVLLVAYVGRVEIVGTAARHPAVAETVDRAGRFRRLASIDGAEILEGAGTDVRLVTPAATYDVEVGRNCCGSPYRSLRL